jgi:hypothetical protein
MNSRKMPNLSDNDRRYLVLDALERAKEAGQDIPAEDSDYVRSVLYGY